MHAFIAIKHFAYVEMYLCPNTVIHDDIKFNTKGDILEPFLEQLWLANGCTSTTIEVLMKFHQENATKKQARITEL